MRVSEGIFYKTPKCLWCVLEVWPMQLNRNIFTDWIYCWSVKKCGIPLHAILQVCVWPCYWQCVGLRERWVFKDLSAISLALYIYTHTQLAVVEWLCLSARKPLQVWAPMEGGCWEAGCWGSASVLSDVARCWMPASARWLSFQVHE